MTLKSVIVGDDPVAAIWDVTLSGDGLTMISRSRFNLSMSTRSSPGDPWPERRGLRLVASGFKHFASPCLSGDGRILVFEGIGANSVRDLWISHRVPVKSLPSPDASLP